MAKKNDVTKELEEAVKALQSRREELLNELNEIDETFKQFGIEPDSVKKSTRGGKSKRGRKKKKKRRGRGSYDKTAVETVLEFVKKEGSPTTAEINEYWKKQGRKGKADNTITKLVKEGKIDRKNRKGKRGSFYSIAS
ncbi:MAG: hypothetical protein R3336_01375 [Phycisphaeraceae bacterium]|nr:hypothetical protein [Phycisphaeraceae bacterium]